MNTQDNKNQIASEKSYKAGETRLGKWILETLTGDFRDNKIERNMDPHKYFYF
jgi:hypothetical protein